MDTLTTGIGLLAGSYTSFKASQLLLKDIKKFLNKRHKPRFFRKRVTGLVLPVNILDETIKNELTDIKNLYVIDIDSVVKNFDTYEDKILRGRKELERIKEIYMNNHYLLVCSDAVLLKHLGVQSRYVALPNGSLYKKIRKDEEITDIEKLLFIDNIMDILAKTEKINCYRKFTFDDKNELINVIKTLWTL